MQAGGGEQLPGDWSKLSIPHITKELALPKSKCNLDDDHENDDTSKHYIKPFIKKQESSRTDENSDNQEKRKDVSLIDNRKKDKMKKFTIKRVGSPLNEMKRTKIDSIIESRLNTASIPHRVTT